MTTPKSLEERVLEAIIKIKQDCAENRQPFKSASEAAKHFQNQYNKCFVGLVRQELQALRDEMVKSSMFICVDYYNGDYMDKDDVLKLIDERMK